ncbi:MAG: hypothetical protein NTV06_07615 [candidate division Zixibacteria bacterium]|nr:hypothetical protein [candidate division Zixibacteria bacterium]
MKYLSTQLVNYIHSKMMGVITLSFIGLMNSTAVYSGDISLNAVSNPHLEAVSIKSLPVNTLPERAIISPGLTQWMEFSFSADPMAEGTGRGVLHNANNDILWSGDLGCSVGLGPKPGFFYAFNPEGYGIVRIFNTNISAEPIAQPEAYPTEYVYSTNGNYLLLGGGRLMLFDSSGKLYFDKEQRLDMDISLAITPNAEYVAVADLLVGSPLVTSSMKAPEATPEAKRYREQIRSNLRRKKVKWDSANNIGRDQDHRLTSKEQNAHPAPRYEGVTSWPQYVTLLNRDGNLISEFPIPYFATAIGISGSVGKYVAVAHFYQLCVFQQDGTKQWEYSFDNQMNFVSALALTDDGMVAAIVNESPMHDNLKRSIVLWNKTGQLVSSQPLIDRASERNAAIQINISGNMITVEDEVGHFSFKLNDN